MERQSASNVESEWIEAIDRTKRREAASRTKLNDALAEAKRQQVAEDEARRYDEEQRMHQAEAHRLRIQSLMAKKEAARRADAERVKLHEQAESKSWDEAVALKKMQEKERRAMETEEAAVKAWNAHCLELLMSVERSCRESLEKAATANALDEIERDSRAKEAAALEAAQTKLREADERDMMAEADAASRKAAIAAEAAAWAENVRRKKEAVSAQRYLQKREAEAMAFEDTAAARWREAMREAAAAEDAIRAAALAKAIAAERQAAAAAEAEAAQRRAVETSMLHQCRKQMEEEDRDSRLREEWDARREWLATVASRKAIEQRLQAEESREVVAMLAEDDLAARVRIENNRLAAVKREALEAVDKATNAATAAALAAMEKAAATAERKRRAEKAREEERMAQCEADEQRAMVQEDSMSSRARTAEAEALRAQGERNNETREMSAMARADRESRRQADALRLWYRQLDQEFTANKATHIQKALDEAHEAEVAARRRAASQARREVECHATMLSAAETERLRVTERQSEENRVKEVVAAKEQRRVVAEMRHRDVVFAEDQRSFEELYRRNRGVVSAKRREEAAVDASAADKVTFSTGAQSSPPPLESSQPPARSRTGVGGCDSGDRSGTKTSGALQANSVQKGPAYSKPLDILEFAQTLSASLPRRSSRLVELDEDTTFFTGC